MDFSPNNTIVKLCLQGMNLEDQEKPEEARKIFLQAWNESTNDFEKFLASHYVTRHQKTVVDKLNWTETSLRLALKINNNYVSGIIPSLYKNIAQYHEELGDPDEAKKNYELAISHNGKIDDSGPFYHGTKADMQVGDLLQAGFRSNYKPDVTMNHIYFTASINGAGLAAEIASGDTPASVYIVEPTGEFEDDPNVTDKKFPGNPTRSYRSEAPLKIVGEVTEWVRLTTEALQKWKERLAHIKDDPGAEIIN